MTKLESQKIFINRSAKEVFDYFADMNNYKILPDFLLDWQGSSDECNFTIQGIPDRISMKITEKVPDTTVVIESGDKTIFDFTITFKIAEKPPFEDTVFTRHDKTEVQCFFEGKIKPEVEPMMVNPIINFFDTFILTMRSHIESGTVHT